MDYEKRYRDLINRLKEERDGDNDYEPFCHVANEILDEFGENESEDERIRRTLAEYFGPQVQLDLVRGVPIKKIRDWLEKQKEKKTDAKSERVIKAARRVLNDWLELNGTDCPDVSGDFAELEYAIREYDGEEKQKENPKSTDSIPADCVSDAKYENRWHKTANSLPDDGRDVLAKDALGNYLLASFDGAQWFVSGYDDEDHPVLHTPPILEWCEIPSNEQKEQKPAEWSEEDEENLGKLHRLLVICQGEKKFIPSDEYDKLDNWLKSLRPSWKPSVEQMEALDEYIYANYPDTEKYGKAVLSLRDDLMKLI